MALTLERFTQATLTFDKVRSVYSGRNGFCCCGCKGKHTYPTSAASKEKEVRGWGVPFDREELSDRTVKMIFNKIKNAAPEEVVVGDNNLSIVRGERLYIVYWA